MVRVQGELGCCRQRLDCPGPPEESGKLERLQARLLIPGVGGEGRKSGEKSWGNRKSIAPPGPQRAPETLDGGVPGWAADPISAEDMPCEDKEPGSGLGLPLLPFPHSGFSEPQFSYP